MATREETAREIIRRHQRERGLPPEARIQTVTQDGLPMPTQARPPAGPLPQLGFNSEEAADNYDRTLKGLHMASVPGEFHPAHGIPLVGLEPIPDRFYPVAGPDPKVKPDYNKPAPAPAPAPAPRPRARGMDDAAPQPARPLVPNIIRPARPATQEDAVRGLVGEVRPKPAAPAVRRYSVHGGRWVAEGQATTYDPDSGRVRIWIPGENRGLNVSLDSLDPESQQFVTGNARRGRVGDLRDGYHDQRGVLHFDRLEPGELDGAPAAPQQAAPKPAAPRPAPPPAQPGPPPRAVQHGEGAPIWGGFGLGNNPPFRPAPPRDPRQQQRDDFHALGKEWLYNKLVAAAESNGMPNPVQWAGEQVRIIEANSPDSEAHPLTVETLQRTPEARWAVPGGGRFAGRVAGQPRPGERAAAPRPQAAPRPAARAALPPAPEDGEARPGPIAPPPPRGPAPRADANKPPEPGFSRFRTRDGAHAFDGEIVSYDPDTGTVKIKTPSGHKVSIEYGYLDDESKALFEGRVNEHNERVAFEDEREDFDEQHGKGAHENRFAPEMAFPEHRGADGLGGARLAARRGMQRDAARQREVDAHNRAMGVNPEPAPVADVPRGARAAAEQAVQAAIPPAQDNGVAAAERRLAEKRERLRQLALAEPRDLARTGELQRGPQEIAQLEQELEDARAGAGRPAPRPAAPPPHLVDGRRRAEEYRAARAAEAAAYQQWKAVADAHGDDAPPPPPQAVEHVRRQWQAAMAEYQKNIRHFRANGISEEEYADSVGVDIGLVPERDRLAGIASSGRAAEHDKRRENASNAHAGAFLSPAARRERAHRVILDPKSTPQQIAAAYMDVGEDAMAHNVLRHHAETEAARHGANAARDAAIAAQGPREGEEDKPDPITEVIDGAINDDMTIEEQESAAMYAVQTAMPERPPEEAQRYANTRVQARVWKLLLDPNAQLRPDQISFFVDGLINGNRRPDRSGRQPGSQGWSRPTTWNERMWLSEATRNGVPKEVAQAWWRKFNPAAAPAATPVGMPDANAIE